MLFMNTQAQDRRNQSTGHKPWPCSPVLAAVLCFAVLVLGGCAFTARPVVHHHYTLGVPPLSADGAGGAQHSNGKVLRVARIDVPQWLAGTAMYYRLAYRPGSSLAAYAYSDWAAPPATLVHSIIRRTLAAGGNWQAVVGPGTPAVADASLHLRLGQFSQVFARPNKSAGIIEATATLVANRSSQVIAQRHFRVPVPAPSPNARGGAEALGQASRQLARSLLDWIQASMDSPHHERSQTQG